MWQPPMAHNGAARAERENLMVFSSCVVRHGIDGLVGLWSVNLSLPRFL